MRMPVLAALIAVLSAASAQGAELPSGVSLLKRSAQYQGLDRRFEVTAVEEGDLDGDGLREYVAAFVSRKRGCQRGGFAVFALRAGKFRVEWAGLYEHARPESLAVQGPDIVANVVGPQGRKRVVLGYRKDFWFRGDKESPFAAAKIRASSQVARGPKAAQFAPDNLLDGDPDSVWRTATVGTGVGEWVEVMFPKPVNVGLVGVLGGDHRGDKEWKDSNRLYRFEVVVETKADRTAIVEDKDITALLKLPTTGKHVNGVAKDERRTKWVEVRTREALSVKVLAVSVYLGDENDELYLSEIDFAELLPDPKPRAEAAKPPAGP